MSIDQFVHCEWEDLVAIVISPTSTAHPYIEWLELPDKLASPPQEGKCVVLGYPSDQNFLAEVGRTQGGTVHQ